MFGRLKEVAEAAALEAGRILVELQGHVEIEFKGEIDLVTDADRRSEAAIVTRIRDAFPTHAILGEEGGQMGSQSAEFLWVIDPLDGTTNYAHGLPIFSVSIALLQHGEPILGIVFNPATNEFFSGMKGEGAHLNGKLILVSYITELRQSLLVTGFPYDAHTSQYVNLDHWENFLRRAQATRRLGSAAVDLAYVAAGRFEGFWETGLKPWDAAAGVLLIREAGGQVTDYTGGGFDLFGLQLLATNGRVHQAMAQVLALGKTGFAGS